MTIKECIDKVDNLKPNQYSLEDKVDWLSFIEMTIINDVLKTHEGYDGRYDNFKGYSADRTDVELIVPSPYDRLYTAFLTMKIDESNGETVRYNNSATLYNSYMGEYRKYYNKTHMPIDVTKKAPANVVNNSINLTDAMYANLVKDLTHILTQYFSGAVSPDKIYDIVMSYMQNNAELFKGKDGKTPIKGRDYFTEDEVKTIVTSTTNKTTENLQHSIKDITNYLTNFFKSIPQEIREKPNFMDIMTYRNGYAGVYLIGDPYIDFVRGCDMLYVCAGVHPEKDFETTYQMKFSLFRGYDDDGNLLPNRFHFKQRYQNIDSQGYFDGWSEWEELFTGDEIIFPEIMGTVDLDYNPDSANAQSGIAVAQAISQILTGGSEFRLLTEITADGETMYWAITKDADGNNLNVHEVFIEINHAEESGYQSIWINGKQEFVRQKVAKGYLEPIYISLRGNLLSGIVGRHSAGVNTANTIFNSKIVSYNAVTEIKTGGYGTSVLPAGTTIKIYAR